MMLVTSWNRSENMPKTSMTTDEPLIKITAAALDEIHIEESPREHLGMSQIGSGDTRKLWLSFRWSLPNEPSPRLRRIFRLGNLIEVEAVSLLSRLPEIELHEADPGTGEQFRFSFLGGHFGGSMDGCIKGIPEAPNAWHVLEIKSVNAARFKDLVKTGVKDWSAEYYGQLQCYMGASGMNRALFFAYCKDNSEIYTERVKPEKFYWESAQQKAERIITAPLPESPYSKREDYRIRMMPQEAQAVYWGDRLPPKPNCRNCVHSIPTMTGSAAWMCDFHNKPLSKQDQIAGCNQHLWMPCLMPAEVVTNHSDCIEYKTHDGLTFWNAEHNAGAIHEQVFSSRELAHISKFGLNKETLGDECLNRIRTEFDGRVCA